MFICESTTPIPPRAVAVRKAADPATAEVERLAGRLEPQLARAILGGLAAMGRDVDVEAVAAALARGDLAAVFAALRIDPEDAFSAVQPLLMSGVYEAGAAAATTIRMTGASFAFNRLNPRLISWLQTYSLGLIREIGDQTREAVRALLTDGMTRGENPRTTATRIKATIGLTERQARAVDNFRTELETFHQRRNGGGYRLGAEIDRRNGFQVLRPDADGAPRDGITERRLRDFRYDGVLRRAAEKSIPLRPDQVNRMVEAYRRKYLAFRARTIARTEALRTTNVGIQDAWRQAIESGSVPETLTRRMWVVARDERLCSVCAPIPGMNPRRGVRFDEAFATPIGPWNLPPIHPNCRCSVSIRQWEPAQLSEASE
jgi:hypothetical protein